MINMRNMKKENRMNGRPVRVLFAVFFLWILLLLLFGSGMSFACKKTFLIPNWLCMLLGLAWVTLCACFFVLLDAKKVLRIEDYLEQHLDRLAWSMTVCLFFLETYISCQLLEEKTWDPDYLWDLAGYYLSGETDCYDYLYKYPNNLLLHFLEVACIRFNRNFGVFPREYERMCAVVVDCATISGACYLTYRQLALLMDKAKAFCGFLICVVLAGFSPWISICYSDSLAIFFPILTLYLYTKPYRKLSPKVGKCAAVIVACIGYAIKPQCIIVLIAIICVELLFALKQRSGKRGVKALLLAVLMAGTLKLNSQLLIEESIRSGRGFEPEKQYGITHFFMMGLNTSTGGFYSVEDDALSEEQPTQAARRKVNIQVAVQRLKEMGITGYIRHLAKKTLTAYHDGTFAWGEDGFSLGPVTEDMNLKMTQYLRAFYWITGTKHEYFKAQIASSSWTPSSRK